MSDTPTVNAEVNRQLATGETTSGGLLSMTMIARRLERQRDAYAETLRDIAKVGHDWERNYIRERHPELGKDQSSAAGGAQPTLNHE